MPITLIFWLLPALIIGLLHFMYGSASLDKGSTCSRCVSAFICEMFFFSTVVACLFIYLALSWWIETSTVSAFSQALFWGVMLLLIVFFFFCGLGFVFLIILRPFVSFKFSITVFCAYYASIHLVQDKTCSLVTSLVPFINVNPFIISALIV